MPTNEENTEYIDKDVEEWKKLNARIPAPFKLSPLTMPIPLPFSIMFFHVLITKRNVKLACKAEIANFKRLLL
jgi:hypothetical protein